MGKQAVVEVARAPDLGPSTAAAGRWRRVTLSDRDWEILAWAHEQKFLAFEQVARWFPEGEPHPTRPPKARPSPGTLRRRARPGSWYATERLRKLVRFDVLRRVPVFTEAAAALLPGRTGHELLEGTNRAIGLARLETIDWKSYAHDRALTDLRWRLVPPSTAVVRAAFPPPGTAWKSDRVLRRELPPGQMPDALLTLGGRAVALELELTRKSTPRYLGIIQRYLSWRGPPLEAVLYVVPSSADLRYMFGVVLPAALRKADFWEASPPNVQLFRFTTPKALESGKAWATVSSPESPAEVALWKP